MRKIAFTGVVAAVALAGVATAPHALAAVNAAPAPATKLLSVAAGGGFGNDQSVHPTIAAFGKFAAFSSGASNLVAGDTNGVWDVYLRNLTTDALSRISVASDGTQGNGTSYYPSISDNGRWVAFESAASNLVPGDTNGQNDIFLRDLKLKTTTRISVATDGTQGNESSNIPQISGNGRYVAFTSFTSNLAPGTNTRTVEPKILVHDVLTHTTTAVSVAPDGTPQNAYSYGAAISRDGRYVAFGSDASNLIAGDTNNVGDVFLRDLQTSVTERVSIDSQERASNGTVKGGGLSVSTDGRYVYFLSDATNLVPGDTNGVTDAFVRDRTKGKTARVSLGAGGVQANRAITRLAVAPNGRYLAFDSDATNLVTPATNGKRHTYFRDRLTDAVLVSVDSAGHEANGPTYLGAISANGKQIVYMAEATNLVTGDTNGKPDVFLTTLG